MKKIASVIVVLIMCLSIMVGNVAAAEKYEVKKGDTLWKISRNYNVNIDDLKEWNDISSDLIYPKQKLLVKQQEDYIVEIGDTLWDIAREYNVSVSDIKDWNDIDSSIIHPDDKLIIQINDENSNKKTIVSTTTSKPHVNEKEKVKVNVKQTSKPQDNSPEGKKISVTATAYTASCSGCSGITATGVNLHKNPNAKVISVDPSVIPLGTKVYVEGYGYATAADTGGSIKGNKIDIFYSSLSRAKQWGVKKVNVTIIE